ncbi:hypothetical protein [Bradyrhizobium cenepequi]
MQSSTARLKLKPQTRAYFVKVARAAWVGYRKPLSGPGSWVARVAVGNGKGWEKTLWTADDGGLKADGEKVLTFWQAKTEVQKLTGKTDGKPWDENNPSNNYGRNVRSIVESIGLDPDVYGLYAFRHTSITRMLLKGTHTSIVAKTHDTSEAMIRKHYARVDPPVWSFQLLTPKRSSGEAPRCACPFLARGSARCH